MSVKFIEENAGRNSGAIVIESDLKILPAEDYVQRMRALVVLLRERDEDSTNDIHAYHVLNMLDDMLPTPEQAKRMFIKPH